MSSNSGRKLPGIAFPGQAIDRRAVDPLLDAHREIPVVTRLFERFGVHRAADADFGDTAVGQPFTYVAGLLSAWRRFGTGGNNPIALGHSLGEITALAYAGAIDPLQGLDLLCTLGELGNTQHAARPSRLMVLMGMDPAAVDWVCRLAVARTGAVLEPSGYNAPTQTIVSGAAEAVLAAREIARQAGGTVRVLPIRGAYHSSLMVGMLPRWHRAVQRVDFHTPRIPVVSSVDGRCRATTAGLGELLSRWLVLPVRWDRAVAAAAGEGADMLWDAGPGEILRDISRRGSALPYLGDIEREAS